MPASYTIDSYITTSSDIVIAQALNGLFPAVTTLPIGTTYSHITMQPYTSTSGSIEAYVTATVSPAVAVAAGGAGRISLPATAVTAGAACWALAGRGDYRDLFAWSAGQYPAPTDPASLIFAQTGLETWPTSVPTNITTVADIVAVNAPVFTTTTDTDAEVTAIDITFPSGITFPVSGTGSLFPAPLSEPFVIITCSGITPVTIPIVPSTLGALAVLSDQMTVTGRQVNVAVSAVPLDTPTVLEGLRRPFDTFYMTLPATGTDENEIYRICTAHHLISSL